MVGVCKRVWIGREEISQRAQDQMARSKGQPLAVRLAVGKVQWTGHSIGRRIATVDRAKQAGTVQREEEKGDACKEKLYSQSCAFSTCGSLGKASLDSRSAGLSATTL